MGWLADLLREFPSLSIAQDKLAAIEAKSIEAEKEVKTLRQEIATLRAQAAGDGNEPRFMEASGVLWKRKMSGGYEAVPYCPTCNSALADFSGSLLCLKCNWQAPLKSFEVPKVYRDLFGDT